MHAGMSLAERQALRRQYRDRAIAQAARLGMTQRCLLLQDDLDSPEHRRCRGEDRGNGGCLCRCHDNPGAVIISREDKRAPG
jgi:hypothetical protein